MSYNEVKFLFGVCSNCSVILLIISHEHNFYVRTRMLFILIWHNIIFNPMGTSRTQKSFLAKPTIKLYQAHKDNEFR